MALEHPQQGKWTIVLSSLQAVPTLWWYFLFRIAPRSLQKYTCKLLLQPVTQLPLPTSCHCFTPPDHAGLRCGSLLLLPSSLHHSLDLGGRQRLSCELLQLLVPPQHHCSPFHRAMQLLPPRDCRLKKHLKA